MEKHPVSGPPEIPLTGGAWIASCEHSVLNCQAFPIGIPGIWPNCLGLCFLLPVTMYRKINQQFREAVEVKFTYVLLELHLLS